MELLIELLIEFVKVVASFVIITVCLLGALWSINEQPTATRYKVACALICATTLAWVWY